MTLTQVLDQLSKAYAASQRGCRCSSDPEWGHLGRCVRGCEASNLRNLQTAVQKLLLWVDGEDVA